MEFNLRKTISTFGSAVAITAVLSNAVYAIELTCNIAYEAEHETPLFKLVLRDIQKLN